MNAWVESPFELTPLLHWHGAVFTAWMMLLVTQTSLVAANRRDLHRPASILEGVPRSRHRKLISEMRPGMAALAGDCRFYAGLAETHCGATVPPARSGFTTFTLKEPIGVVGAIAPWNTPLGILGWKLFPALAAGNTVVAKPSEVTPTSTLMLAALCQEAGIPDGVVPARRAR